MKGAEKEYMGRVASLGCMVCRHMGWGQTPAQLHHVREGQGMAQRSSNWLVVPLCQEHHTGAHGIHGHDFYLRYRLDEMDLLAMTLEALNDERY
jgi:hypothetical protein